MKREKDHLQNKKKKLGASNWQQFSKQWYLLEGNEETFSMLWALYSPCHQLKMNAVFSKHEGNRSLTANISFLMKWLVDTL